MAVKRFLEVLFYSQEVHKTKASKCGFQWESFLLKRRQEGSFSVDGKAE